MTVAETAIREPESAAATVPIVLEVPADSIADFKLLTFESNFDELALKLREEAIKRFATGLEIPAELLLGMGDTNHWGPGSSPAKPSAWVSNPSCPPCRTPSHSSGYAPPPSRERRGLAPLARLVRHRAAARVRSNRSETALQTYDRGVISAAALRRETGFEESDAPNAEEEEARNKQNGNQDQEQQDEQDGQEQPTPDLPVDETTDEPGTLPASAARTNPGLIAAADGLIWAALSSAGDKLLRTPICPRSERARAREIQAAALHTELKVEPGQVEQYRLLDGAWARVPEIAKRYGMDTSAPCLTAALDAYARELIAAGIEHSYEVVPAVVTSCLGRAA